MSASTPALFEEAADRFAVFKYDVFVLLEHLTKKMQRRRWDAREIRASWTKWAADVRAGRRPALLNMYLHVPFCTRRCTYCMHFSRALRSENELESYLGFLLDQARFFAPTLDAVAVSNMMVGGGTPSLLSTAQLGRLFDTLNSSFRFDEDGERSFEANPASLNEEKLVALRAGGINRLSLGVQSMNADVLGGVGRGGQESERVRALVRAARAVGFSRGVNVDLILGLVGEDADGFLDSFAAAAEAEPDTIFVSALRPIPAYVRRHYNGDGAAAAAHMERAAQAAESCVESARRLGYRVVGTPGQEWVFSKDSLGPVLGREDKKYLAEQTSVPFSLLGLGWNAHSRVRGERTYFQRDPFAGSFDPAARTYEGAWIDERDEMLKSLFAALRNDAPLLWGDFLAWFGRDARDEFGPALEALSARGFLRMETDVLRPTSKDARSILLCALELAGRPAVESMHETLFAGTAADSAATPERPTENLELNVGLACNNRCLFCMSGDARAPERRWLPAEAAREELRRFRDLGCTSVGFLGGEPTAYPHIVEAVGWAKELGYRRVALCTNGMKLSDETFVDALLGAGATRFTISLHSRLPEVEDALTGVPGNFARKLKGLKTLLARKAAGRLPDNVSLNPVLNRRTYLDMTDYIEFFRDLGVDDIRFNYIWPQARVTGDKSMIPSYREAMPKIARAVLLNERHWKMTISFGGVPPCMLRWTGLNMSARAAAHFAERYFDESGVDLSTRVSANGDRFDWRERKRDRMKTHAPACFACLWYERCDGVWKTYGDMWGLDEMVPVEAA
ncbi:MAG: radical SAM protein [Elusimicrobia bacterium]|nr:radical SAM protein [Elusimicrobiota bacterium]